MSLIINRYDYQPIKRKQIEGKRKYMTPDGGAVASVTTILDATSDKSGLMAWRKRVGEKKAQEVVTEAAGVGTRMHKYLEDYVEFGEWPTPGGNPFAKKAHAMATQIRDNAMVDVDEIWGSEVVLYYPDLYAGATDIVGIYNGRESIIDFKQTNKPKKREWIDDYFIQLGAYAMAHNFIYDTKIQSGIILMCSKDRFFQKFEVSGKEFVSYQHAFLKKVDEYYRNCNQNKEQERYKNEEISEEISH